MALRPKRQLLQSPTASLNTSTSPSIASTVPILSPSVRRSARIQDSPSISYRDSLRSSVLRDTPVRQLGRRRSRSRSRSRIFGLDASDRSKLDTNSDSETEKDEVKVPALSYQGQIMSKLVRVLLSPSGQGVAASLLLLVMLVFTQWVAGQGVTSIMSWVVGPLSGLRMAIMSLPEILRGSVRSRSSENEVDNLVRLMNNDKLLELIESVTEKRMLEMGKEVDRKIREEAQMVNEAVDNVRKTYFDIETKRLAMREDELKMGKARKEIGDGGVVEVEQDVRQKMELLEIQVEQLKLNLVESTQHMRERREVVELEETERIRKMVDEVSVEKRKMYEFEQELWKMKEKMNRLIDGNDLAKFREQIDNIKQQVEQTDGRDSSAETVKEVLSNLLTDPLSPLYEKAVAPHKNDMDRLESKMNEVVIKLNQTEPRFADILTDKVSKLKQVMEEELIQLTKSLHSDWSQSQANNTVTRHEVSTMVESHLSLFSADRTGQVDWASQAVGGSVISTPHTTTHPTHGQVFSLLGVPIWRHSPSPRQILQPYSGAGQCWAFSGQTGQVVLQLGQVVTVTGITIEHIRPSPDLSSAPKSITIWAQKDDISLLNLTYSISTSSSSVQTFPIPSPTLLPISKLRLEVTSNWGHPEFTCLYRVRVHGTQVKEEKVIAWTEQVSGDKIVEQI